ncbi:Ig-like domain-containing protein [Pseudoalteromonas sp. S16_S37]|uniref:Ig-like domain-containing protein n=1 Tax=Pseudoalteromonas sp. S16_S37 TaxID=2720228 RepID=UPI001680AEA0|nr:Ig-like domain-containing protein [Pseudoalteromonas sp. S16_S37]MBD1582105.1 hypothetical protein [Pseudoalteromonas sp. S16_S37]
MKNKLLKLSVLSLALTHLSGCDLFDNKDKNVEPYIGADLAKSIDERSQVTGQLHIIDRDGRIKARSVLQTDGPEVIDLQITENQISFITPEVANDTEIEFTIQATDDDGASSELILTSIIKQVNRTPQATPQTISVQFNESVEFSLVAQDPDNDLLAFSLQDPEIGELQLVNEDQQTYRYTPGKNAIAEQVITLEVNDGQLSDTAVITLKIVDTSAPLLLESTPKHQSPLFKVDESIELVFSDNMDAAWLTAQSGPQCSGPIQLSANDYSSCLPYDISGLQQDEQFIVTIKPSNVLDNEATYQLKITDQVTNFHGTALAQQQVILFKTGSDGLLISEISASQYPEDNRWIEIFNGTANDVDLGHYSIVANSLKLDDYSEQGERTFPLPSHTLASGEFIVVQSQAGPQIWQNGTTNSAQLILIGDGEYAPAWDSSGFVELKSNDTTIDFVRFGKSTKEPSSAEQWNDTTSITSPSIALGQSLVRSQLLNDTNSAADWQVATFMTPAGPNDVNCSDDKDLDGIPDCAEQPNSTFAGLPLYDWGARVEQRDIFIEVDYMQSEDAGVRPHKASLDKVKEAFAQQGIAVHFDTGSLFHPDEGTSTELHDLGGGNEVAFAPSTSFATQKGAPSILEYKAKHFDLRRRPIFHYLLMANSQQPDGSPGSSGVAELYGNDLIISMGGWGLTTTTPAMENLTYNLQAGTIMHELGHNLGLLHGGNDNANFKPNHVSVMNYMYQLDGLPTIGNNEGDRYFRMFYRDNANCFPEGSEIINGPFGSIENFTISYSHGTNTTINEALIDESKGLHNAGSSSVDFDCNGSQSDILTNFDINGDQDTVGVLTDFDEWSNLVLNFATYWSGANSGLSQNRTSNTTKVSRSIMHSDKQAIQKEQMPPTYLLKLIKQVANYEKN